MTTQLLQLDPSVNHDELVQRAAEVCRDGGLVAFRTETVYGVGTRADDREAVQRLRSIKSRGADRAFTVHLTSRSDAVRFAPELSGLASRLARRAWPGPLTLIVPVSDPSSAPAMTGLNGSATAAIYHNNSVGLRCPDDPWARAWIAEVQVPVVAASANLAGRTAAMTAHEVLKELNDQIDLVVDGGRTRYGKPSTIVRVTGSDYAVVREGVYDAGIIARLSKLRLLLVCTGNTCRSPMAAALVGKILSEKMSCDPSDLPSKGVEVSSAGTAGGVGGASAHAIAVMKRRGLDLTRHVSRAVAVDMIEQADYVFVMTHAQQETVLRMVPSAAGRVMLLAGDEDIRDPAGGTEETYEHCAQMVEEGLRARLQEVLI